MASGEEAMPSLAAPGAAGGVAELYSVDA